MTVLHDIDFHRVFKISPTPRALLTPDFVILDANDEFVQASERSLQDLMGHNAFDLLPPVPREPNYPRPYRTALEAALASREREVLRLTRHDIANPARPGVFEERYWSSVVTPMLSADFSVEMLELSAQEVTSVVMQFRAMQAQQG
jgi:PAS domain-containing protein